jgi:hypothetical protein
MAFESLTDRLSNVGGEMVASLDASEDFQPKILKLASNYTE